jgi:hypothetical protein
LSLTFWQAVAKQLGHPFIPRSRRRRRLEGRDAASRLLRVKRPIEILQSLRSLAPRGVTKDDGVHGGFSADLSNIGRDF